MPNQLNSNTLAALERVMQEIKNLVDHPRIQQRTWVARGKEWLPILQIVHGELTGQTEPSPIVTPPEDIGSILIKVNMSADETYVQVKLADIDRIQVNRVRRSSSFTLKDRREYLTSPDEAQRIVDTMRKRDEAVGNEQK
jgi:hypothetical protein